MLKFFCVSKVYPTGFCASSIVLSAFSVFSLSLLFTWTLQPFGGSESYGTIADFQAQLSLREQEEDRPMSKKPKKRQEKKKSPARSAAKSPLLRIEQLEPRQLFSVSTGSAPPPLEHMAEPLVEHMLAPQLEATEAPPLLSSVWTPLVYAGADITISQSELANLSAEVIANNPQDTVISWGLVSGPGTATFGDTSAAITTAVFSEAGTYELEMTVTNNGVAASDRVMVNVTAANVINIDQAWLDAQGDGPYYLDQQDSTYVLQTDVTIDGTAFVMTANRIVFDLNGNTITYGNSPPITILNGSFEEGTGTAADDWDFTNATTAERYQGEYLANEIYDGDYSLKFGSGFVGSQSVASTQTILLEPNTTYSLSAMFQNVGDWTGAKGYVKLIGQNVADEFETNWNTKNRRGIQLRETKFTTGEMGGTYAVVAGVENPNGNADFGAFIDDIKVQRTLVYGVAVGVKSWEASLYPGVSNFGVSDDSIVKNGSITQGQDTATFAHGILLRSKRVEVDSTTITVKGANSSAISGPYVVEAKVHNNTLISNVQTINLRDQFDGAVIHRLSGEIYDNTIIGGPHTGIYAGGENRIYNNQISIRSEYTNGFAIMLYNDQGSEVYSNTIDNFSGDFSGRGIHIQRANLNDPLNPTIVRDNTITVRELDNNQEYGGAVSGGAYGIQLEAAQDVEVYGNQVDAISERAGAYAFRIGIRDVAKKNIRVYDNVFRAVRVANYDTTNNDVQAASLLIDDMTAANELLFENNILISNQGWIGNSSYLTGITFTANELRVEGDGVGFEPLQSRNYGGPGSERDARAIRGLRFVDTTYTDALSRQVFMTNAIGNHFAQQVTDAESYFFSGYSTTFVVKDAGASPLANAAVSIVDNGGNSVFSGSSDANGQVTVLLNEFKMQGDQKSDFGPYTVTVQYGGEQGQQQFSADQVQDVEVQLGTTTSSVVGDNAPLVALAEMQEGNLVEPVITGPVANPTSGYENVTKDAVPQAPIITESVQKKVTQNADASDTVQLEPVGSISHSSPADAAVDSPSEVNPKSAEVDWNTEYFDELGEHSLTALFSWYVSFR